MKKLYPIFLLVIFATNSKTQPVLTAANFNPVPNEAADEFKFDTTGFSPGSGGAGLTWNFSWLSDTPTNGVQVYSTFSTPYGPDFSSTNIAVSRAALSYDYYLVHATGQDYYGKGTSTQLVTYSDPGRVYAYPLTYLSSSTDSLHASYSSGGYPATRKGKIVTTADAYGTLNLPTGTFKDVLRVKSVWTYEDRIDEGSGEVVYLYEQTYYNWLMADVHFPLLTYVESKVTTGSTVAENVYGTFLDPASITTGVQVTDVGNRNVKIFPNPDSGEKVNVFLNCLSPGTVTVTVLSTSGQQISRSQYNVTIGDNYLPLDMKNAEPGIYLVDVNGPAGRATGKLVIE